MSKFLKRIITVSVSIVFLTVFLVGCGQEENKKKAEILEDTKDADIKTIIVTQNEKENKSAFEAAKKEKMDNEYKRFNNSKYKSYVEHYILPSDFEDNKKTDEMFNKIKKDKNAKILIVSANKAGLAEKVKKLKKERRDILTISADLNEDDQKLIKDFDLNFKTGDFDHGERIVDLAKSMGAQRFIYFVGNNDLNDSKKMEILDGMKKESKKIDLPIEEVKIPDMNNIYEEKAFVSNSIDSLIKKYGRDINIYTFDSKFDEILASKVFDDKFFIAEFSDKNVSPELMKVYGLKYVTRQANDYVWMNSQIGAYIKLSSDMERRIGATAYNPEFYTMKIAADVGEVLKSKKMSVKKAYNSVFLENISNMKNKTGCGFINKYKGVGNYKIIDVDQILY